MSAKLLYAMLLKYAREEDYYHLGQRLLWSCSSERSVRIYQKEL